MPSNKKSSKKEVLREERVGRSESARRSTRVKSGVAKAGKKTVDSSGLKKVSRSRSLLRSETVYDDDSESMESIVSTEHSSESEDDEMPMSKKDKMK
jgi:hypothetical protein